METRAQHGPEDDNQLAATRARVEYGERERVTLHSWKEIAAELNSSVRTVQRCERKLGLPVRRIGRGRRGVVCAFKDEVHGWLRHHAKVHATHKAGLFQSINDFLTQGHSSDDKQICPECHSPMKLLKGQIWIYGTSTRSSLSLPFCPVCDAGDVESFCRSQIIQ